MTGITSHYAGVCGYFNFAFVNGPAQSAKFDSPYSIRPGINNDFIIADSFNSVIRRINSTRYVSTIAGGGGHGFANGLKTAAKFNLPTSAVQDSTGNIYVTDYLNNCKE